MQTHRLKTTDIYWDAVKRGEKNFEVRINDRAFQTGDILELVRVTGYGYVDDVALIRKRISYILQGGSFGIDARYCVMALVDPD